MKREPGEARTLEILEAIEARRDVTQRRLADQLGIALGLANAYLRRCVRKGLVLAGMSEISEIASIRAHDLELEILGTFGLGAKVPRFIGRPVWTSTAAAPACDAVLFTALAEPLDLYAALLAAYPAERALVPEILRSVLDAPRAADA